MSVIYKAYDPISCRTVALRTIASRFADNPEILERFYLEARSAGSLQHPSFVTVYEFGKSGNTPFIATEYLDGVTLQQMIAKHEPTPIVQRVGYIVRICQGLEYSHRHGVIHRDIKPSSVIVTADGTLKILDFGIAQLAGIGKTQTGMVIGTLGYMSPQQIQGQRADARSDIWAVGMLSYELLCYQKPFTANNVSSLLQEILSKEPPPLRQIVPDLPLDLEELIGKMLCKNVEARFQTMGDVLVGLERVYQRLCDAP